MAMSIRKVSLIFILSILIIYLPSCASEEDKKGRFFLKGNEKLKENDLKGASEYYSEALKIDPDFADALLNRGIIHERLNNLDAAIADYSKILEKGSLIDTTVYFQRGLAYLDNGEFYKALNDAQQLEKINSESWKTYFLLGLVYEKLKNNNAALKAFEKGLDLNPNNPDLVVNMATILFYQKSYDQAISLLEKAEQVNDKEPNIYNLRSMIAFDLQEYQKAYDWVSKAIQLNSRESYYYNNRGLYALFLGDMEKGIEDINFSIKQNPKNAYAWRNKGIYYYMKGDKTSALKYLSDALSFDPEMELAQAYFKKAQDL
ncbi:MAG: tetratricopeptide repeat protein [Belliella pelovolcani]